MDAEDDALVTMMHGRAVEVHGAGAAEAVRRAIAALEEEGELDRVAVWEAVLGRLEEVAGR
ncbi:hypothetical protein ACSMXM_03725 [Pacificimonas sp. ICDLI1SI03]